jgi:hypothetical protein
MIKRFLILTFFLPLLIGLNSCKKKDYDDSELMVLIRASWALHNHEFFMFQRDKEKYDFVNPANGKYYYSDHGDGLQLQRDSLTINIVDSKLYIKLKDGTIYETLEIEKATHDKITLSGNIYHRE